LLYSAVILMLFIMMSHTLLYHKLYTENYITVISYLRRHL